MKLVFAGTPEFAAEALAGLMAAGHEIVIVLTQPDRPSGRGMQIHPSPVKALASSHGIPVLQPRGLRLAGRFDADARAAHDTLRATPHDAMVVAAYGLILPPSVLDIPRLGCINIHASLLPRWRGAAPIQRAIEAGDAETGITIMQMDAGLDTGPVLAVRRLSIASSDTGASLTDRLAALGAEAIVASLPLIEGGVLHPMPQHPSDDASAVTYATKLGKTESILDFGQSSRALVDRIRAFDPWPGCSASWADAAGRSTTYKIWRAEVVEAAALASIGSGHAAAGEIVAVADGTQFGADGAVVVATADGAIALTHLQKPGGKRQAARLLSRELRPGWRSTGGDAATA